MKIKKINYINVDHAAIAKKFEGDLTFVNYMNVACTSGGRLKAAVYRAAKPNKKKGHKEYMLLNWRVDPILLRTEYAVIGRTKAELSKDRKVRGVLCTECETALYSLYTHDFHKCGCDNETMVDGGTDYLRFGGKDLNKVRQVVIDLLTDKVRKLPVKNRT